MLQSKTLRIGELYALNAEIRQLLSQKVKLQLVFKFELTELFEQVADTLKPVEDIREQLVQQYLSAEMQEKEIKAEECSEFPKFKEEFTRILEQQRTIQYIPIKKDYLTFETDLFLPQIFELVESSYPKSTPVVDKASL